jgi:hypothetical protein
MNHLLAALSGRSVREIEEGKAGRLIKERSAPRVVDKRTLDNLDSQVLSECTEEKDFNRRANIAFVFLCLGFLPLLMHWFYVMW